MKSLLWVFTIDGGTTFNTKKRWSPLKKKLTKSMTFILNRVCTDKDSQGNFKSIEPSYFLEAMDMYRQEFRYNKLYFSDKIFFFFRKVVFIYVYDDVSWGKKRLLPRVNEI